MTEKCREEFEKCFKKMKEELGFVDDLKGFALAVWQSAWNAATWNTRSETSKWQDISTAPKDGTHVLFYSKKWGVFSSCIPENMAHYKRTEAYYPTGGRQVTKWMPLPKPPEVQ